MLRKIRIILSVVLWALLTFFFLDFAGVLPWQLHVITHIQFIPALLSVSIGIVVALLILTLLFGRVYCSSICPMGTFQDIVTGLSKRSRKRRKRFSFSPPKRILRWSIVVIVLAASLSGFGAVLGLLDPYSAYGRIATNVFKPVYLQANNLLESIFSSFDNYTFYRVDAAMVSVSSFFIALGTLVLIAVLAWKHGRTWCNTFCPVGTVLGFLSRFSFFKIRIDADKCTHCGNCATYCKASCMDSKAGMIDYSRCVNCFDCLGTCKEKALIYAPRLQKTKQSEQTRQGEEIKQSNQAKQADQAPLASKRRFLLAGLVTTAAAPKLLAQAQETLATLGGKKSYQKMHPITPPGSVSRTHFADRCTSCHLCVSKCPSHVLKPAFMEYGLGGIMQPTVSFEKGFCNFDCTVCGDICPSGAIKPLTIDQKHLTQMGTVVFIEENCIVYTDGTSCGACSEHCPTQAIAMVPFKNGLTIPQVNTDICVGCGGCEYVCPARPFRAVHIEGSVVQKQAHPFVEKKEEAVEVDGFGF
ncbi:MAG: 4Fe-4S dicluster domain-containing protein [Bacteroides sp.]|uniref:4Fe-4S dicluster domain-containing protein n=1 Tax=Bacteroides sp. TaxID=29523 RepID=UPI002FCA2BE5